MANCPFCQSSIQDDFGLVVCPKCGKSVFVDIYGEAQEPEEDSDDEIIDNSVISTPPPLPEEEVSYDPNEFVEDVSDEEAYGEENSDGYEFSIHHEIDGDAEGEETSKDSSATEDLGGFFDFDSSSSKSSYESLEDGSSEVSEGDSDEDKSRSDDLGEYDDNSVSEEGYEALSSDEINNAGEVFTSSYEEDKTLEDDEDSSLPQSLEVESLSGAAEEEPALIPETNYSPEDLSEISDFGNSELSQAMEGSLYFRIKISDIDSGSVREELIEALNDKKFMWNGDALVSTVRGGCLVLQDVSPAKAIVLINRLKLMSLTVVWEQYAIQDS